MAVRVKICGLTRPADAAVAVEAGASYLGVVFVGGPRLVTPRMAREIAVATSGLPLFGVFGAPYSADAILRDREEIGLAGAQLHGRFEPGVAARLRAEGMLVWAVARVTQGAAFPDLVALSSEADAVLIEPAVPGKAGGAGVPLAPALGRRARTALAGRQMVLAGGLRPASVAAAIAEVAPDVVDVSSGVEVKPGHKDPELIRLFLEAVRGDQSSP